MVSFVIVTHCASLANAIAEEAGITAPCVRIIPAGGRADGGVGTDIQKITDAIEQAMSSDGVIVLVDMGSSVMTTELAIEELGYDNVIMADCPIAEGAIAGSVLAQGGAGMDAILEELMTVKTQSKL